jgi:hypothetical protein
MNEARFLDALNNANSLELFRLSTVIDRLLADPKRIIAIRKDLRLGQTVRFFDFQLGDLTDGCIIAMGARQVTIQALRSRRAWKLPYAAIETPKTAGSDPAPKPSPKMVAPGREDFRRGERVSFEDRYLQSHVGLIVRINQLTATVESDDKSWRVPFALLRPVHDI